MAKRKSTRRGVRNSAAPPPAMGVSPEPGETGAYLVVFRDDVKREKATRALKSLCGARSVATASDFSEGAVNLAEIASDDAVLFDNLGIAVVSAEAISPSAAGSPGLARLAAAPEILVVERERFKYAGGLSSEYLRGFADAANRLAAAAEGGDLLGTEMPVIEGDSAPAAASQPFTWGVNAVKAHSSPHTGREIRVAVLDTGMDLAHPDFAGRAVVGESFIDGQEVQDRHGHGTHCVGTACGRATSSGTRYGVAGECEIYVGKVLSNQGRGPDRAVLAGISWAVRQRCQVISMSLSDLAPPSEAYERAGREALRAGSLIVSAAGNNAERPGRVGQVESPGNCQSIMAIGAIDRHQRMANFSPRSLTQSGGKIDLCGPGVDVLSAVPGGSVDYKSGTSMAAPHVAGCAALWCQATGSTGVALYQKILSSVRPLNLAAVDCGAGLVQAPQ